MESPDQNNTSPDSSIEIPMDTLTRYMLDPCEKKMNIIYILVLHKLLKPNLKKTRTQLWSRGKMADICKQH